VLGRYAQAPGWGGAVVQAHEQVLLGQAGQHAARELAFAELGIQVGVGGLQRPLACQAHIGLQLGAVAAGGAGVAEGGAPARAPGADDLVVGAAVEHGRAPQALDAACQALAPAQFVLGADAGLQCQVQAAGAVGAVGQLGKGGGFKTAAGTGVDRGVGGDLVGQCHHRQGLVVCDRARIVGVAGAQVMVVRHELHAAVAQAGVQAPGRGQLPGGLDVGVDVGDGVFLVAAQCTLHPQGAADKVLIALAVFVHPVHGQAGRHGDGHRCVAEPAGPAGVHAGVVARHVDHAPGMAGSGLGGSRNRLVLRHAAVAGIGRQGHAVHAVQAAFIGGAHLGLLQRFAGVEAFGHGRAVVGPVGGAARGCLVLRPGQALGVLRVRGHGVGHQGQPGIVAQRGAQLGIRHVAVGGAVVAPAVGHEAAGTDDIAQALCRLAAGLGRQALLAVAAKADAAFHKGPSLGRFGEQADHAAGGVTVQR